MIEQVNAIINEVLESIIFVQHVSLCLLKNNTMKSRKCQAHKLAIYIPNDAYQQAQWKQTDKYTETNRQKY